MSGLGVKLFDMSDYFSIRDWRDSLINLLPCSLRNKELFFKGVVLFFRLDKFELGDCLVGYYFGPPSSPILNSFILAIWCWYSKMNTQFYFVYILILYIILNLYTVIINVKSQILNKISVYNLSTQLINFSVI